MSGFIKWLFGGYPGGSQEGSAQWRLGFVADYGNYVIMALMAALAAMIYLTIRTYRREGDAPRGAKALLAGLRITVILLVAVILFRPAIIYRFTRTLYSSLVVLLDDSISMSLTDSTVLQDGAGRREKLAGLLGVSPADLEQMSRAEIVRRLLVRRGGAIGALAADHPLVLMRFSTDNPGRESYTDVIERIDSPSMAPGEVIERLGESLAHMRADGYETDIAAALGQVRETMRGRRMAGVVLVSDGRVTSAKPGSPMAGDSSSGALAEGLGAGVFAVMVGDATPRKNVAVTALHAPGEVRTGALTEFSAVLSCRNAETQKIKLRLLRRNADSGKWTPTGKESIINVSEHLPPAEGDSPQNRRNGPVVITADLKVKPEETGKFVYKVVADPLSGETNQADNSAEASVSVRDAKINILLVGGYAGLEFQYLRNFLFRSRDLYRLSVWQQNADADINQVASTGMRLSRLPRRLAEIIGTQESPGYDVVILYDPRPTQGGFDENFVKMLKTFVVRHGGGMCYLAGNKHSESVLRGGGYRPLSDLMPVMLAPNRIDLAGRIGRGKPRSWQVRLTDYGREHTVTRIGRSLGGERHIFDLLPGIYWSHPVADVKPAGRVLAVHSNPMRRGSQNDPLPLMVFQPVGMGRVVYVGFDETWRWRAVRDGYYHRRLWGNLMSFLAAPKTKRVVLTTGGERFVAGEKMTVRLEAYDEEYRPLEAKKVTVRMTRTSDGQSSDIELKAVPDQPGHFAASMVPKRTGAYELSVNLGPDAAVSRRITVELPQAEMRKPEADPAFLKTVVSRPQNFLEAHEFDKLSGMIPPGRLKSVREIPRELWDTRAVLLLIVILLAGEWILRKKYNMA